MNIFKAMAVRSVEEATRAIPVIDFAPAFRGETGGLDAAAAEVRHACEQVGFFCCLRKCLFGVDDVAPPPLSANLMCSFLTLLDAETILAQGECHLVNFHRASRFPYDKVRRVGVWLPL